MATMTSLTFGLDVGGKPPSMVSPKPGDISTTICIATWHIWEGRNGESESAARSCDSLGVDIGLVLETKYFTQKKLARKGHKHSILSTDVLLLRRKYV